MYICTDSRVRFLPSNELQSRDTRDAQSLSAQGSLRVTGMAGLPLESHHMPGLRKNEGGHLREGPSQPLWTKPGGASAGEDLCVIQGPCRWEQDQCAWTGLPALHHRKRWPSSLASPKDCLLEFFHRGHQLVT